MIGQYKTLPDGDYRLRDDLPLYSSAHIGCTAGVSKHCGRVRGDAVSAVTSTGVIAEAESVPITNEAVDRVLFPYI